MGEEFVVSGSYSQSVRKARGANGVFRHGREANV